MRGADRLHPIDMTHALDEIVQRFSSLPQVEAIAIGGSRAAGAGDARSDYDIYTFVTAPVPPDLRLDLAEAFDPQPEIGNDWWGESDYWGDGDTWYDVMFWDVTDFERGLRRVIEQHRPSTGYSTAFWYTMRNVAPLFDRDGWLASVKDLAATPYPDALADAIVRHNHPLLRTIHTSYRAQIARAIDLDDPVSVNHRITELLATTFDILFAVARQLHPGEKRQLDVLARLNQIPASLGGRIRDVLTASGEPGWPRLLDNVDAMCDEIDDLVCRA
jgi:predicted nucleotidyltransferase